VSCFSPPCLPPISPKESSSAGDSIWRLINEIRAFNQSAPVFLSDHRPTSLRTLSGSAFQSHLLSGKRVFGFCGIGNPGSFRDTLLGITAEVTEIAVFRDHVMYTASDARMIARDARKCRAEWIVTTEKDIMKFREIALPDGMAGRLVSLGIEFVAANDFYETVLQGGLDDQVRKRKKPDTK